MQWQLVVTLVCCLLLRFLEVGGGREEASVLARSTLDVVFVCAQSGAALFMAGNAAKDAVLRRRGRGVVAVEGGEDADADADADAADEETVLLLRARLRQRDEAVLAEKGRREEAEQRVAALERLLEGAKDV